MPRHHFGRRLTTGSALSPTTIGCPTRSGAIPSSQAELTDAGYAFTLERRIELEKRPIDGNFDLDHPGAIHFARGFGAGCWKSAVADQQEWLRRAAAMSQDLRRATLGNETPEKGGADHSPELFDTLYHRCMSRIGEFADDDVAGWIRLSPELGKAMAGFSTAVYDGKRNRLPMRVREIARTVIAHDNECVVCVNTRDADGPAVGVDEDLYTHAAQWPTWPGYSEQERVAAEFAHRFATEHTALRDDDEFWQRCRAQFSDELLADLTISCAMWLGMGRMLRTLDIGQACRLTLPRRA